MTLLELETGNFTFLGDYKFIITTAIFSFRAAEGLLSDSDLNEVANRATGLQVRAVQDPFASSHCGQILLITQRRANDDVGAAGVKGLLVKDYTTYSTKQKLYVKYTVQAEK